MVLNSSGPKYMKFNQMLATDTFIRVSHDDILNEIGKNIKNITMKLNDIHIESKIDTKDFINLNKKLKKFHLKWKNPNTFLIYFIFYKNVH